MKISFRTGVLFCVTLAALGIGSVVLGKKASVNAASVQAPRFEVDPMWPKPLPNHWVIGNTIGVIEPGGCAAATHHVGRSERAWCSRCFKTRLRRSLA